MKQLMYFVLALAVLTISCKKEENGPSQTINDPAEASDTIGEGTFTSYDHGLGGKAILYVDNSNEKILRFENFNMTAGPDVYVFLSKTSSYSAANVIQVVKLTTGYTSSAVNFEVNSGAYSSEYKYVLVYCVQYSSLFGYAELL